MGYEFTIGDVAFLDSPDHAGLLDRAARLALTGASLIGDLTLLRRLADGHAAAVAETVTLRRRAVERWGPAAGDDVGGVTVRDDWCCADWFYTDTALQQAPPPPVARYRAARIAEAVASGGYDGVHDVTCSIGTDLAALDEAGVFAIGSDLDPVRLAMARHNLAAAHRHLAAAAHGPDAGPPPLVRADARSATTRGLLRYADPARRDITGRRISSADTIPPVAELDEVDPAHPPVLRLPPGIDYERLARPGEVEIVSWRGTVREAVAWPAECATARRRATVLAAGPETSGPRIAGQGTAGPGAIGAHRLVAEQLSDRDPDDAPVRPADRYLIDPDPAIVRAHLVRHYAARHGLALLDDHLAYLTGPHIPPGVRGFAITDSAPFSDRVIRQWCRRDGVGTLEIKQRGTPVIPDRLRRRVAPTGDSRIARTVVIARIGRRAQAFWCRAVPATARDTAGHTVTE